MKNLCVWIQSVDANELRWDVKKLGNSLSCVHAEFVDLEGSVDCTRNFEKSLLLLLLALPLGNVLKQDRDPAPCWINSNVIPRFEAIILVRCLKTLERLGLHCHFVPLTELSALRVGKDLEHILTQNLLALQTRAFLCSAIPVGESVLLVEREKP